MTTEEIIQRQIAALDKFAERLHPDHAWRLDDGSQIGYVDGSWIRSVPYISGVADMVSWVEPSDIPSIVYSGISGRSYISEQDLKEMVDIFTIDWEDDDCEDDDDDDAIDYYDDDGESMYEEDWNEWRFSDWY